jgi:hypothetical protein
MQRSFSKNRNDPALGPSGIQPHQSSKTKHPGDCKQTCYLLMCHPLALLLCCSDQSPPATPGGGAPACHRLLPLTCRLLQHACCLRLRRSATSICGIINRCTIVSGCTTIYVALVSASLPVANSRQANIHIFRN